MALLMLLPAGLATLMRATARDVPSLRLEFMFVFMLIPQALLPLASLIYASGMIQDELEEQTLTYLLMRPIPRWAIYMVKWLATLTAVIFLTVVFTAITYAAIYIRSSTPAGEVFDRCLKASLIHSLSVTAYCSLFGLLSLVTRRILIVGVLYIAIFEGLFANLAFGIRLITVIYYARLIAYHTLSFAITNPYGTEDIAADAWQLDVKTDPLLVQHPSMATCILTLLITSAVFTAAAAYLVSRREFYIKTPEKA